MATQVDIKERLHLAARLTAIRHSFRFTTDCENHVLAFIDSGIVELAAQNMLGDNVKLQLAEAGIAALVEKMVEVAQASGLPQLQESTYMSARGFLCPLWPFCL